MIPRSDDTRHATLDAGLAQAGDEERGALFLGGAEDGEELDEAGLAEGLLDEVDGDAPPGEDGADDPEVGGDLDAGADAGAEGEQAAGDGAADGERRQHAAEDEVAGGGGDGLYWDVVSGGRGGDGRGTYARPGEEG